MMLNEMKELSVQIKSNIIQLIEKEEYSKADQLINQYMGMVKGDIEVFSIKAMNFLKQNMLEEAKEALVAGLAIDKNNFDLFYNLGYLFELKKDQEISWRYYLKAKAVASNHMQEKLIQECLKRLEIINEDKADKNLIKFDECKNIIADLVVSQDKVCKRENYNRTKSPLVTIGVINYNQENYLEECLESVLAQDYPNKEILIIDDCSTDGSLGIINRYLKKHDNIKLTQHKQNSGSGSKGPQDTQLYAKGKYFTYIDADDYYADNDIISTFVEVLEQNEKTDFVYGCFELVDKNGNKIDQWKYKQFDQQEIVKGVFDRLGSGLMPMIGLYRNSFYQKNKLTMYYDSKLKIGCDTLNSLINIKHEWNYSYIDKTVLCYRRHESNVTSQIEKRIICTIILAEYITNNFPENWYLPEIRWHEVKERKFKRAVKSFYLGHYFFQAFKHFTEINAGMDADRLLVILSPLASKMEEYFAKSVRDQTTFQNDIAKLKQEYSSFIEQLKLKKTGNAQDKQELPKVSIIIPTYNRKIMLKDAVESVLAQDYPNLEIIVTDNASTDGTEEMMQQYINDSRIRYFRHKENMGQGYNVKNAIFNISQGQYVLLLCDDDYLFDNNYICKAVNLFLQNPNVHLIHAKCTLLNIDTNTSEITKCGETRIINGLEYFIKYEDPEYPHITGLVTALFDKEKAIEMGAFEVKDVYGGDTLLYFALMLVGDVGIINENAGVYRIHKNSTSNTLNELKKDATVDRLKNLYQQAILKGLEKHLMDEWLNFRVYKYIRWNVVQLLYNKRNEAAMKILLTIRDEYPLAFMKICEDFGIRMG